MYNSFISPMKKGIEAAKIQTPPVGSYEEVDLSILPKFICFKAALLKEKMIWQNLSLMLSGILLLVFVVDRVEISMLYKKYREKEYIVLPDFIPVSPHTISDKYIEYAVDEFIQKFGSISADSIDKQYKTLADYMELQFRRRFEEETLEWVEYVKMENITESLHCPKKEIISNNQGIYQVTAICKKETYMNHDHMGNQDEVIKMELAATSPKKAKRWVVKIRDLKRSNKRSFKSKK